MDIKISGGSDDLIEVDGGIYEEFDTGGSGKGTVTCSNGVVLACEYDERRDGIWRITATAHPEKVTIIECTTPTSADGDWGTDVAVLGDDVDWVECNGERHHR